MPGVNPLTGKPGPAPQAPRDGDKAQARAAVALAVRNGKMPRSNELPCEKCGHIWELDGRRHEWHHHNGYGASHHLDVIALCTLCHSHEDNPKASQTACEREHEFTADNTKIRANGTRECCECRRLRDRGRRDAAWWRAWRAKKRAKQSKEE